MLEKIGNFTATESLGPDLSADMLFLFFICCASSQQPQTADVLTLKTEIKPDGTFFRLPPLHRVGFVGARDSRAPIVELGCLAAQVKVSELFSPPSACINCCHGYRPEVLRRGDKCALRVHAHKALFSQFSCARQMEIDFE